MVLSAMREKTCTSEFSKTYSMMLKTTEKSMIVKFVSQTFREKILRTDNQPANRGFQ